MNAPPPPATVKAEDDDFVVYKAKTNSNSISADENRQIQSPITSGIQE